MFFTKLVAFASFVTAGFALATGKVVSDLAELEPSLAGFVNINNFQGNGLNLANNFPAGVFNATAVTAIPSFDAGQANQQVNTHNDFGLRLWTLMESS